MAGFGAFGKIPALGDFFRIGLGPGFVEPWDAWLQSGMLALSSALGPEWPGLYLSAPIWRFTLAAGVAGPEAVQGVVMPSVDRVGRRFPLTLARMLPGPIAPRAAHLAATETFAALEEIALDTLDDMPREALAGRLMQLVPAPVPSGIASRRTLWTAVLAGETRHLATDGLPDLPQMQALFDMNAPFWHATEDARP